MSDKRYLYTFTVEGAGQFPFDMLRYDSAFPASERDSYEISHDDKRRRVTLQAWVTRDSRVPTSGRWESFLWKVVTP